MNRPQGAALLNTDLLFDQEANKSSMLPLLALRWPTPADSLADDLARLVVDHADVDGAWSERACSTMLLSRWTLSDIRKEVHR